MTRPRPTLRPAGQRWRSSCDVAKSLGRLLTRTAGTRDQDQAIWSASAQVVGSTYRLRVSLQSASVVLQRSCASASTPPRTLHTLRSFILQKTSEPAAKQCMESPGHLLASLARSDFRAEMASCLDVAGQLNKMLQADLSFECSLITCEAVAQDSALRPPPPV